MDYLLIQHADGKLEIQELTIVPNLDELARARTLGMGYFVVKSYMGGDVFVPEIYPIQPLVLKAQQLFDKINESNTKTE